MGRTGLPFIRGGLVRRALRQQHRSFAVHLGLVLQIFDRFHAMVTGQGTEGITGGLKALSGVSKFPLRVKCASLGWHAMKAALAGETAPVTTDDGSGPDSGQSA